MRNIKELIKLTHSHHTLDDISGNGSTIHAGFLSVLTEEEEQLIINETFQSPDVFWSEERRKMLDAITADIDGGEAISIGDPTAPVNPEDIKPGDYVVIRGWRKELCKVVSIDNTSGEMRTHGVNGTNRVGWSMSNPIRHGKLFKRCSELNEEQAKAIDVAFYENRNRS